MSVFQVDVAQLQQKSAAVQSTITRLQAEVNTMDAQLRQLGESWRGSAATNFLSVFSQWRATQNQVEQSLGSIQQALSAASRHYAETEQANAAMFRMN